MVLKNTWFDFVWGFEPTLADRPSQLRVQPATATVFLLIADSVLPSDRLSGVGGELGDGLGALRHGVLGELTRKEEADGSLDLAGRQGGLLVVARQTRGLQSDALEDVVDEGVQDGHATLGDTGVRVDLLQHLMLIMSQSDIWRQLRVSVF